MSTQQFPNFRLTTAAVIHDGQGRYLILRRNPERYYGWGLVKGGVELGEDALEAIIREIAEEIGVVVTAQQVIPLHHKSAYYDNGNDRVILVEWFMVQLQPNIPITLQQEEWVEYRWATLAETLYQLAWQTQQRALKIAAEQLTAAPQ